MGQDLHHMNVEAISYITFTTVDDLMGVISEFDSRYLKTKNDYSITLNEFQEILGESKINDSG